jgi:UDP-N-acetyl-D-mannosaminuronic acid transferase (WecB/TagA/CpsF family)
VFIATAFDEAGRAPASCFVPLSLPSINMLGQQIVNASEAEVLNWLSLRMAFGIRTCVYYLNAHCSNVAGVDYNYREALSRADLIIPDGFGVKISARMHGEHLASSLSFTDFIPLVCQNLSHTGASIFLLGGEKGVAEAAAENLVKSCSGTSYCGDTPRSFPRRTGKRVNRAN